MKLMNVVLDKVSIYSWKCWCLAIPFET